MSEQEGYHPKSDFLNHVIKERISFADDQFGAANLERLIAMTTDGDQANRDWAVLLLGQTGIDTMPVREALLLAAEDQADCVRAEAIQALAQIDCALARPYLAKALADTAASMPIFEAAAACPDRAFIEDLRVWAEPSDNPFLDREARAALDACEGLQDDPAVD